MATSMEPVLRWAAQVVGVGASVVDVKELRADAGPWRLRIHQGGTAIQAVLRVGDSSSRQQLATEAAALRLAEAHQLAAPRLLAVDLDGAAAGVPVVLMTALAGSSKIPTIASVARLRGLGAAAAALHTVTTAPRPDLPLRVRPLADVDFAAERGATGSSPLLEAAEARITQVAAPQGVTVFVHGDLWQGNTLWIGDRCVGMVDWDAAGVGHPGVDLGTLRLDAAIVFGLPRRRGGAGGLAAGDRSGSCRDGVLGPGGGADHPDRHGNLAAGGPRPWPRRPRHSDPDGSPRQVPARGGRPARPPVTTLPAGGPGSLPAPVTSKPAGTP
jgi:aminoglycoside phosphotransferase